MVRVVVADDHPVWRSGLRADLGSNFHVVGEAGDAAEAIEVIEATKPDLVVCDRLHEVELGKWRNVAKHSIGDFVEPEQMFDWLEKRWRDVELVVHMAAVSSTTERSRSVSTAPGQIENARTSNPSRVMARPCRSGSASDRRM